MPHPLAAILERAAGGAFPPADGVAEIMPPDHDGTVAVVALTGHAYVLAAVEPAGLAARQTDPAGGGFGGALSPDVLTWLAGETGAVGSIDVVLVAQGSADHADTLRRRDDQLAHPRVQRAVSHRRDVGVYGDDAGLAILGRGLVGRWELSVELFAPDEPAAGTGRRLIQAGLELVPDGEWCWAQVTPGNARSLRAFLACGFVPIGSEVLITS